MNEILKRNIRESLVYALTSTTEDWTVQRLVISEFYHSLNRKLILQNCEVEGEISQAYVQLERM